MGSEMDARVALVEAGRRLYEKGLIGGGEGNLCLRLEENVLLVTPSGASKGKLSPDDLVLVSASGESLDGKTPSSEIKIHLRAMAARPDCGVTIHAHPPVATGFSVAGRTIPDDVLPESSAVLGPVALCPFAMPGTWDLPATLDSALPDHKTFLLANHGALVLGRDLEDACQRMESLEQVARTILVAELLGSVNRIPPPELALLHQRHLHGRLG